MHKKEACQIAFDCFS